MIEAGTAGVGVLADALTEGVVLTDEQLEAFLAAARHAAMARRELDEAVWARGACRDGDPEVWQPVESENAVSPETAAHERAYAAEVCGGCPVRDECLALSLKLGAFGLYGVWGGLSARDRRMLRPIWLALVAQLAETSPDGQVDEQLVAGLTAAGADARPGHHRRAQRLLDRLDDSDRRRGRPRGLERTA